MRASGIRASMSTGYLQLIDGTKQGKDDYRTCTRENSPQTRRLVVFRRRTERGDGFPSFDRRQNKKLRAIRLTYGWHRYLAIRGGVGRTRLAFSLLPGALQVAMTFPRVIVCSSASSPQPAATESYSPCNRHPFRLGQRELNPLSRWPARAFLAIPLPRSAAWADARRILRESLPGIPTEAASALLDFASKNLDHGLHHHRLLLRTRFVVLIRRIHRVVWMLRTC